MADERTRRRLLAALGSVGAAGTAGCLSRLRSRVAYTPMEQVSLSVGCVPADRDPSATAIAGALRDNLEAVGVDVSLALTSEEQLLRDVLYNQEFDLVVTRVPGHGEPDELRSLLGSRFAQEEGLQNPFGYADRRLDELLDRQWRRGVEDREELLAAIQRRTIREAPFLPLTAPTDVVAVSPSLDLPRGAALADRRRYLLAVRAERDEADDEVDRTDDQEDGGDRLGLALFHPEPTANRNVLAAEVRTRDRVLPLLYDRLLEPVDGEYVPWLAEQVTVTLEGDRVVRLRPGLRWHDGEPLTASDVAFTYEFLADTALGELDTPVPAPRFRSQSSIVADATVLDERTVRVSVEGVRRSIVRHALAVPILPEHRWRERSEPQREYLTAALLDDVEEPVGSGPFAFVDATPEEDLELERFDDHFLRTADALPDALEPFAGGPAFETLEATSAPNVTAALNALADGEIDVVDGPIPAQDVERARETVGIETIEHSSRDYYALWFDVRNSPLSNYAFRRATARLLDRDELVETAFDGMATSIESPLHGTDAVPPDLEWTGTSTLGPFPGLDGDLDVERARDLYRDAGYRYHEGELLARQPQPGG